MSGKVVLSRSPYLGRTRSRMDLDTVVQYRSKEREELPARTHNHSGSQTRNIELEARLLAVCDSLEAKTQQCKFLMHENEQLNSRLIEISKGAAEQDSLSISSRMVNSHAAGESIKEPQKEFVSVHIQTLSQRGNERQQPVVEGKFKEEISKLTVKVTSMEEERKRVVAQLAEKTKLAEKLNRSLLEAIESSSALMKQRGELARKLEQTTINMRQIQALYNNAKRYIFKGMDISQSEASSNNGDIDSQRSMGDISRMECQRSRELEIMRYQLTLKSKECEDKDMQIMTLKQCEVDNLRLKHLLHDQQKELQELRKRNWNELTHPPNTRLGKAHRTITTELLQIVHQTDLCERLNTLEPRPPQHMLSTVPQFIQRTTSQLEHLASTVIARKLEVDRFMRELHQRLSTQHPVRS